MLQAVCLIDTKTVKKTIPSKKIRRLVGFYLRGRISYMRLFNKLNMSSSEVDAIIADLVHESVRKHAQVHVKRCVSA